MGKLRDGSDCSSNGMCDYMQVEWKVSERAQVDHRFFFFFFETNTIYLYIYKGLIDSLCLSLSSQLYLTWQQLVVTRWR